MPESILEWGIALILSLQSLGDWLIGPMNVFTLTGNVEFYLLILPIIYWSWDARLGLRVAIIFLLGLSINLITKVLFHDPRPYWANPEVRLLTGAESSFGIPSGHAQNSVKIWGMLAVYLRKSWAWIGAIVLIFFIGFSRIYLGVHFPTDVLVGWAMGIMTLILFLQLEALVTAQFNKLGQPSQIAIIFGISLLLILIGALFISQVSASWQLPAEWAQNAAGQWPDEPITPFSAEDLIITGSTFFGLVAGAILFETRLSFNAGGSWGKRLGRYLVGVVGVFILWQGLGALFDLLATDGSLPGYVLRYIHYTLIGGWITALAPWLFLKMKLA